ncbi:MAG: cation:proton antiporter [Candidatus Tectomicrobia bacterium]|nr:cation:proton antiporter [Candidatus Tectomicrobia bacterium]
MRSHRFTSGGGTRLQPRWALWAGALAAGVLLGRVALGAEAPPAGGAVHFDIGSVLLKIILMLAAAKICGAVLARFHQPAVLGELIGGVLIGSSVLNLVQIDGVIEILSEIGVIILLFEVGLESSLGELMKVGARSLLVAVIGVVTPMILGILATTWLNIGGENFVLHLFMGATLAATSVGITARVFTDLGRLRTDEARVVLGAAVIDDVLGLMLLAIIVGLIKSGGFEAMTVAKISVTAFLFLVGALVAGNYFAQPFVNVAQKLRVRGMMIVTVLVMAFVLSFISHRIGLATIVGSFAAGLLLERVNLAGFREKINLQQLIRPVADLLVPLFFVHMGMLVDLRSFLRPEVLGIALLITVLAVIGKLVCGVAQPGPLLNKLIVGVGMIPRGEVGLIFAGYGLANQIIDASLYSAILVMVIITTFITPPLLKLLLGRQKAPGEEAAASLAAPS